MAELTTLARPYARALFNLAKDSDELQQWSQCLLALQCIFKDSAIVKHLSSPRLDVDARVDLLKNLCGAYFNDKTANLVHLLVRYHRLNLLPVIADLYVELLTQEQAQLSVHLRVAQETPQILIDQLSQSLTKKHNKEIKIMLEVDASLLAGAVIRIGDSVIDGSLNGRLRQLAQTLD